MCKSGRIKQRKNAKRDADNISHPFSKEADNMKKKPKIVFIGGGSVTFSPKLLNDFILTPGLENAHYELLDINPLLGETMVRYGSMLRKLRGASCTFNYTGDQKGALKDADIVLITISTGGLEAMRHDLSIPEEYGIFHTVGDTVGPGGWSRALRNIGVFKGISEDIQKYCPTAAVLNYTNPLSVLTNVLYKTGCKRTVGLCHGVFEVCDTLVDLFELKGREDIQANFAGVNHFFWILDFTLRGENGYELLEKKLNGRSLFEVLDELYRGKSRTGSYGPVFSELYNKYGYLTYSEDRHTVEFFPDYITGDERKLKKYNIIRTSIEERMKWMSEKTQQLHNYIDGTEKVSAKFSGEAAAQIAGAVINGKIIVDVTNQPNIGQVSNLPKGTIVETPGVVNNLGFRPLCAGELPGPLLDLVMPHAVNQNLTAEAGLQGDKEMALEALYNDPLCKHLKRSEVRKMGIRLLEANRQWMQQF